jgi:hypothetical protein
MCGIPKHCLSKATCKPNKEGRKPSQGATGRKQHDFPKVTFRWNFEGMWGHYFSIGSEYNALGAIFNLKSFRDNLKMKWSRDHVLTCSYMRPRL